MFKKIFVVFLFLLSSCSNFSEKVIARSDNLSKRPKWVKDSKVFSEDKEYIYITGSSKLNSNNANINMGYRIAENNAKIQISSAIEQKLNYIFQNAEEGTNIEQNQVKFVSGEASKLKVSGIYVNDRYWEKVLSKSNDDSNIYYNIYSRIKISKENLKKAIDNTINKNTNKISKEFKQQVDKHWDELTEY